MSYPMPGQPPAPERKPRPGTVSAASWLLFLVAAIYVASFVATLITLDVFVNATREAYAGTELEGQEDFAVITTVAQSVIFLLVAGGLVALGILNNLGKNPARIVTWVVGGLVLCCTGAGLALQGVMTSVPVPEDVEGPDPMEVQRQIEAALPDWYITLSWIGSVVAILALIVALILLALPPSNEFFRKTPPQAEPPAYPPPPYPPAG